ncbi:MAG: hypothetical protein QM784_00095 [Polyangiaceae bacterium]
MPTIPPKHSSRRPTVTLRPEELMVEIEQFLEHPDGALESLVGGLAKGQYQLELWDGLHNAAQRDHREAELAFAYEQVTADRRVRALPPEAQVVVLDRAAGFFAELFGDLDSAAALSERLFAVAPGNRANLERLSRIWSSQARHGRLARIHVGLAKVASDGAARHAELECALALVRQEEHDAALSLEVLEQIVQLEPDFAQAAETLEEHLLRSNRIRDAARRMEARLAPTAAGNPRQLQLRERLLGLYTKELPEPPKAMAQVEAILPIEPTNPRALQAAEALCSVSLMAPRALAILSDAHERQGNLERAAALLSQELKLARGARRNDVARRLAILREEVLGDPAGALELLANVVISDPSDDDARERFVRVSLALDRAVEAARQLGRAVQAVKDPQARVKLSVDLGILQRRTGELRRARAAFEEAVRVAADERSSLRAARELVEIYSQSGEWRPLVSVLEIQCRLEPAAEARHAAARRLIELCEREMGEPELCVPAWHALEDASDADTALRKLQAHYESSGDSRELGRILALRAQRASEPEERRRLDVLATELLLRTATNHADAIAAWQGVVERHGPVTEALDHLITLLDAEGQAVELARVLELRLTATNGPAKSPLLVRLGRLQSQVLGNEAVAVQCYGEALQLDPSDRAIRGELAKWLDVPMLRGAVVRVLEPVLRSEPPSALLVDVLKAKIEDAEANETKLEWVAEALAIAGEHLGRHDDAFAMAVTGLGIAMAVAPSRAREFLAAATNSSPFVDAKSRVTMLSFALGQNPLTTPESRGIAALLSDALAESGEPAAAIELLRRALAEEPASPELLARMDDLLAAQASPEERIQLYTEALARETRLERRRDIFARMAALTQQHFQTPEQAIELWNEVLALDETHFGAHQSLVQLYTQLGDDDALKSELKRVLVLTAGERKLRTLDAIVEVELRTGEHEQALVHALAAIEHGGAEDDARTTRAEQLARELGQFDVVERLIEMRVKRTSDPAAKMKLLASLGKVRATLQKSKAASDAFYQAAELAEEHKSMVRAADLLESALTADASQDALVHRLWDVCLRSGDLARLDRPLRAMLKVGLDEKDVVRRLTEVAGRVATAGDGTTLAALVDVALLQISDVARRRQLLLLRARALRTNPNTYLEAAKTYRKLLEGASAVDDEVWAAYQQFFEVVPPTDVFRGELRWFYERRIALAADPIREILDFARLEEMRHEDVDAALGLYARVLEMDSDRLDVWLEMARLRRRMGDSVWAGRGAPTRCCLGGWCSTLRSVGGVC